jgi:tetratricopeptide (TPR) repeat protein
VVNGAPFNGALIPPPTDTDFKFKLADTGDVMTFRWASLDPSEIRRIQKLFGVESAGPTNELRWGKEIDAVRVQMKSGKPYEGMEDPDRAPIGFMCLKTRTSSVLLQLADIEKKEKIVKRESELYSPEEVYERLIQEKPPASDRASDHIELAQVCSNMGLYPKAIDHLEMAKAIDPKSEESSADFRKELLVKHSEQQARKLYQSALVDINSGDNASAVDKIARFLSNFPNSEFRTRMESLAPKITEASKADQAKKVIFMYYTLISEQISEKLNKKVRVDANNRVVPAMPGKQVTTKQNKILRGTIASEDNDVVTLTVNAVNIKIMRRDILSVTDVDLSEAVKQIDPTFSELKKYVTDKNGGLTKAIEQKISDKLKLDPNVVKKIWDSRANQEGVYNPTTGAVEKTEKFSSQHYANFGKASWLQDGVKPVKQQNQQQRPQGYNITRRGNQVQVQQQQNQQQETPPEFSDDPDVWWTVQTMDTKYDALKALAADKLFIKKRTEYKACPTCAGAGTIRTIPSDGGEPREDTCTTCRGLKNLTTIIFE